MRRYGVEIVLGLFVIGVCCARAPWVMTDARTPSNATYLGIAPVWTTSLRFIPGAKIDIREFAIQVGLSLAFVALIGLGRAMRRSG